MMHCAWLFEMRGYTQGYRMFCEIFFGQCIGRLWIGRRLYINM
jgi:hypothetical protein